VTGLLPEALTEGLIPDWARLTRWHPEQVGQELLQQATASQELNPALTVRVNAVLGLLAERENKLALKLLREMERTTPLNDLNLRPLAAFAAPELADLLLTLADQVQLWLTSQLRKLSSEQVGTLLQRRARGRTRLRPTGSGAPTAARPGVHGGPHLGRGSAVTATRGQSACRPARVPGQTPPGAALLSDPASSTSALCRAAALGRGPHCAGRQPSPP